MKEIVVTKNEAGKGLAGFLKSYLKEASTGFIHKMLRKKNITLNGKKAEGTEKLREGDSIKIFFSDETLEKFRGKVDASFAKGRVTGAFGELPVIYEDNDIVLVNKPVGVLSQKAKPEDLSLNEWLIEYLLEKGDITTESLSTYKPSICNRLDRNTSGLVICAKSLNGARTMNGLIKERRVDKFYRTIIKGRLSDSVTLKGYLYKDESKNKVIIKESDPKDDRFSYIETVYEPLTYLKDKDLTLLEVKLVTGKPHQIRAHLSSIAHPIIGDFKYGGPVFKGLKYQLLHSYRLVFPADLPEGFDHLSGKEFVAELPAIFKKIIED